MQINRKLGSTDSGLACLLVVARSFGIAPDAQQIIRSLDTGRVPLSLPLLLRALRQMGLNARLSSRGWSVLGKIPVPAIARHKEGGFFLIGGIDNSRVMVHNPVAGSTQVMTRDELAGIWSGLLLVVTRRRDGSAGPPRSGLGWFLPAIRKYRWLFAEILLASLFIQIFALLTPLFFQVVIDKVLVHHGLTTLDVLVVGMFLVAVFEVVLGGLRVYVFAHTANRVDVTLGAELVQHMLNLPLLFFNARRVADLVSRVRDLDSIRQFITGSALTLLVDLFFTLIFFLVLFLYSPVLAAVVLASVPVYCLLALCLTPVLQARIGCRLEKAANKQAFLIETLGAAETIKAAALEPRMQSRWETHLAEFAAADFKVTGLSNLAGQSSAFVNKVTMILLLWLGARLVMEGSLSLGQLVAFNMLANRISAPVLRLSQLWHEFQQAAIALRRLDDILVTTPEPVANMTRSRMPDIHGRIRFDRVNFRYRPESEDVLRELSFDVEAGEIIGIVGRSGSGKSTLARLLLRLYVPLNGRILLDGINLSAVDPAWLRQQVGLVLQESHLFNRTVRENITLCNPAADFTAVLDAASMAGAHDFIMNLPFGYDSILGENGCVLSGGQRQRIAIARVLLANPKVLIFDEATSALDAESEQVVHASMHAICHRRTVFIIAHRVSALAVANRIIVLENGRITESGSRSRLIRQGGYYANMHASQTAVIPAADQSGPSRAAPADLPSVDTISGTYDQERPRGI